MKTLYLIDNSSNNLQLPEFSISSAVILTWFKSSKLYPENANSGNTINLEFQDYAIIEQLYNQVKMVLETELKQNTRELKNMKRYLEDIDKKFATYIRSVETLNELRKGD